MSLIFLSTVVSQSSQNKIYIIIRSDYKRFLLVKKTKPWLSARLVYFVAFVNTLLK